MQLDSIKRFFKFVKNSSTRTILKRLGLEIYYRGWGNFLLPYLPIQLKHWLRIQLRGSQAPISLAKFIDGELVSIIIPVYNHAKYLTKCLDSALSQTYKKIEIIVVDDASPDPQVQAIIASYQKDARFKYFRNSINLGISNTQNKALICSSGKYIAFLDCDDYLHPDAVLTSLKYWDEQTVYSHSGRINVDEEDKEINRISFVHLPRKDYFKENIKAMYATHFKIIRRDVFAKIGLFDSRFDAAQDYDMLMRIAFHFPSAAFTHPPEFLYYHRIHKQQASQAKQQLQEEARNLICQEAMLRKDISEGQFDKFLSIIMLSFGKHEQTLQALQSLKRTIAVPHEIILLDNGSDAQTVDFIKQYIEPNFTELKVFYNDTNLGPSAGRRLALQYAKGDYFIFFDNDEIAEPGWLEEILVRAKSDSKIAMICCKVIFPDRRLQFSGGEIKYLDDDFISLDLIDKDKFADELETAVFRDCDWCPIGATLFTVNPANYLDANYINVFEDAGVSLALKKNGWRLVNSPASWVWHEHMMFKKDFGMKARYIKERYDPTNMLISLANFYKQTGLIIKADYVWRENRLSHLTLTQMRETLIKVIQ